MKLSQAQLKQIIKEELQKTLYEIGDDEPTVKTPQSQPEAKVIPDLPWEANKVGIWQDWSKVMPLKGDDLSEFNNYIGQNIGKFGMNNSVIAVYGDDKYGRLNPTCLVFIPEEKFLLRKEDRYLVDQALKAIKIKLSENGFKYDSGLTVPGSQR